MLSQQYNCSFLLRYVLISLKQSRMDEFREVIILTHVFCQKLVHLWDSVIHLAINGTRSFLCLIRNKWNGKFDLLFISNYLCYAQSMCSFDVLLVYIKHTIIYTIHQHACYSYIFMCLTLLVIMTLLWLT